MNTKIALLALLPVFGLSACAIAPNGPSVLVLPGTGKNFEQFASDESYCRSYAQRQIDGATPAQAAADAGVASAVTGTVVGAAVGAAIGGRQGAAVGGGAGLLVGSASGAEAARLSGASAQQRYDHAFIQCMYGMGHRVPVPASAARNLMGSGGLRQEAPVYPPPPPPSR